MIRSVTFLLAVMAAVSLTSAAHGQFRQRVLVIENARVHTGETWMDDATIVVRGRRIAEFGPAAAVSVPNNAQRIDGSNLTVTPGLIDVGSTLGMTSSSGGPTGVAFDAFDRFDSRSYVDALRHGVTSIVLVPSGGSEIGPRCSLVRLVRDGDQAFGATVGDDVALTVNLNSSASAVDRLRILEQVHHSFSEAEDHRDAIEEYEDKLAEYEHQLAERRKRSESDDSDSAEKGNGDDSAAMQNPRRQPRRRGGRRSQAEPQNDEEDEELDKPDEPDRNPTAEVLIKALEGELPVRIRADREADLLNALELAERFKLDIILEGAFHSHRVADRIADAGVPVVLDAGWRWAEHPDDVDAIAILDEAGVQWALAAGGSTRLLLSRAALISSTTKAAFDPVAKVTGDAAALLDIDDQLGRIVRGASADLVLWSGDPTHPASRVERVLIEGRPVYNADDDIELTGGRP